MKKFISMLLVVMMVFAMAGCKEEKKDAKVVYEEAMQKMQELDSTDLSIKMDMDMTAAGETIGMEMEIGSKVQDINKDTMKMEMPMSMNMPDQGISMDLNLYYADGYYYMDMLGMKIKTPMDLSEMQDTLEESTGAANISSEGMTNLQMEEKNGSYVISFVGDPEKMMDYTEDVIESMESMYGSEGSNVALEKMDGTININKDGYITEEVINMVMTMEMEGETVEMTMAMTITYNNPGEAVTVELPDLSEYQEMEITD